MKITRLSVVPLALMAAATIFAGMGQASAQISIHLGGDDNTPPPPPPPSYYHHEHRWDGPGRGAVWIDGENVWQDGRWVWVGGYWTYPPHPGAVWVPGHYGHSHYHPGHWE
jgi:hypothetical protein